MTQLIAHRVMGLEATNETVKKSFLPDNLLWVVVGDMNKVEQGIRELNLGDP